MNGRERLSKALKGEATDRPAVICANSTATNEQAETLGIKWPLFHQRSEEMARMAFGACEIFGFDAVRLPFCQTMEAEALGCEVSYRDFIPGNDVPLYTLGAIPQFPDDFLKRGRIPDLLDAIRLLKRNADGRAMVLGGVVGPLTIARALLDSPPLLKASFRSPEKIVPFLEVGRRACIQLALELIEAGAEAIVIEDMTASPDILHPRTYNNMVAEYERQVIKALPCPVILHICGNVALIAEKMAWTEADGLSIDPKAQPRHMREKVGERMPLIGGIDTTFLSLSNPNEIKTRCLESLKDGINILAPGCSIPANSPSKNLRAMVHAAEELFTR